MKRALIIQGGWEGHEPEVFADFFAEALKAEGYTVVVADTLKILDDAEHLASFDLISPCWSMGQITSEQSTNLSNAVRAGTGLGGFHGGMGDAFRGDLDYEWMVGGHFLGHPYVGEYSVQVKDPTHPITEILPASFIYDSEQYYMLIDPCIHVLADCVYSHESKNVCMPVIWTKQWGQGRVFYSALGHKFEEFQNYPAVAQMTLAGLRWATRTL